MDVVNCLVKLKIIYYQNRLRRKKRGKSTQPPLFYLINDQPASKKSYVHLTILKWIKNYKEGWRLDTKFNLQDFLVHYKIWDRWKWQYGIAIHSFSQNVWSMWIQVAKC